MKAAAAWHSRWSQAVLPYPSQGDVVAISPYESHLDSRLYFDAPTTYNPGR